MKVSWFKASGFSLMGLCMKEGLSIISPLIMVSGRLAMAIW